MAATGASDINGSTSRGRGFDCSVFASESFNSLEVPKFSARVSKACRSSHRQNVPGGVAGHDYTIVDGSSNVDFSAATAH